MIKTKNNFVIEEEVYPSNEKIFGGNEVAYEAKCFDGFAILTKCAYEDEKYPETLYMVYPKRNMVLNDEEFAYNVLDYRGLFDIDIQDVRYGDIMIYCGEVCKDVPSVYSDIIKRENIVSKVNDLIVKNGSVQYKIEQAAWNVR